MAVRLKLRSVVAGPGSVGVGANKGARKKSLDANEREVREEDRRCLRFAR
jgi:hypothetical protein